MSDYPFNFGKFGKKLDLLWKRTPTWAKWIMWIIFVRLLILGIKHADFSNLLNYEIRDK